MSFKLSNEKSKVLTAKSHTYADKVNSPLLFYQTCKWWFTPISSQGVHFVYYNHIYPRTLVYSVNNLYKSGIIVQIAVTYLGILLLSLDPCLEGGWKKSNTVHRDFCAEGLMWDWGEREIYKILNGIYPTTKLTLPPHIPTFIHTQPPEVCNWD